MEPLLLSSSALLIGGLRAFVLLRLRLTLEINILAQLFNPLASFVRRTLAFAFAIAIVFCTVLDVLRLCSQLSWPSRFVVVLLLGFGAKAAGEKTTLGSSLVFVRRSWSFKMGIAALSVLGRLFRRIEIRLNLARSIACIGQAAVAGLPGVLGRTLDCV